MRAFVACAPGLEPYLIQELAELEVHATAVTGGAEAQTDLSGLYRVLLGSSLGLRVLLRIGEFPAAHFSQLERGLSALPLPELVTRGAALSFKVSTRKSRLYHSGAIAERAAAQLHKALGTQKAASVSPAARADVICDTGQTAPTIPLQLRLDRDTCTVSIDVVGGVLHKRGYRLATSKAPLREDIASGLLWVAGYRGRGAVVDPLCGSGTLVIEAANRALGLAPGRLRSFAIHALAIHDPGLAQHAQLALQRIRAEAGPASRPGHSPSCQGSDRDAGAVRASIQNAHRAGVDACATFTQAPISAVELPAHPEGGLLVTNPPYGLRIGDSRALRNLYAALGKLRHRAPPGYRIAFVTSSPPLAEATGLGLRSALMTDAGGVKVYFYVEDPSAVTSTAAQPELASH